MGQRTLGMSETGRGPSGRSGMSRRTLGQVRYGSGDRRTSPEPVERTTRRSRTGRGTLREVRERSGHPWVGLGRVRDHWVGPGQVEGTSGRSETGRGTPLEVRDVSRDPWRGLGRVGGRSGKSGTGWGYFLGGPGRVGGPSESSRTGRGTLREVGDGSWEP